MKFNANCILFPVVSGIETSINSLKLNLFSTILTTSGIAVGIFSVIVIVAVLNSLGEFVTSKLDSLSMNGITIKAKTSDEDKLLGINNALSYQLVNEIKAALPEIENITPVTADPIMVLARFKDISVQTSLVGTTHGYLELAGLSTDYGFFFSEEDNIKNRNVVFIGASLADKLKFSKSMLGQFIALNNQWYRVIGIAQSKGDLFGLDQDNFLVVPLTSISSLFNRNYGDRLNVLLNISNSGFTKQSVEDRFHRYFRRNQNEIEFDITSSNSITKSFDEITRVSTVGATVVVGISIFVGGIGVMNVMLLSVGERTHEFGIKKSMGAPFSFIFIEILTESVIICCFGATIGALSAMLVIFFIDLALPFHITVSYLVLLLCFLFIILIGVIFGVTPAYKAAELNPSVAIKSKV
ncbi:ABC transporter permease [Alteromonas sp. 14N.309.X.WAT.G.H12]|uniref:ABC transporter permease n=1 Tax=Alteromonas sp. 14N.309.X.WAT.G.H12 TaxID=3120824 RepID=UPI002FD003C2